MHEVIMQYSGEGEDSHNLTRVGELIRCRECRHYNEDDWSCRVDGTGGWQPTDYCSAGQQKEDA